MFAHAQCYYDWSVPNQLKSRADRVQGSDFPPLYHMRLVNGEPVTLHARRRVLSLTEKRAMSSNGR